MSHNPPKRNLPFLHRLLERAVMTGDLIPSLNLMADTIRMAAMETEQWTNRSDDAVRIPDMLHNAATALRKEAVERCMAIDKADERIEEKP